MEDTQRSRELQQARREERVVYSADGTAVGRVDALYYDLETGRPQWIGIRSESAPGTRTLVPVSGAAATGDAVRVPFTREQVETAPRVDSEEIDEDTEDAIAAHYRLGLRDAAPERAEDPNEADTPAPTEPLVDPNAQTPVVEPPPSVVRSEEELLVSKERVEAGRVRLRKWVETEPVQVEVELMREVAHVIREPVEAPVEGVELGEAEIEIPLYVERPTLEKQVVAAEKITIHKDVETEVRTIEDELRVEHVDVDESAPGDGA